MQIVYFGDYWDESWRRSQQFVSRLADLEQVDKVYYIEFPLSATSGLKAAFGRGDRDARARWKRVRQSGRHWKPDRVHVITPLSPLPFFRRGALRSWNVEMAIRSVLLRVGYLSDPVRRRGPLLLWMANPFWRRFVGRLREDHLVYDYMGNFPGLYTSEGLRRLMGLDEEELARSATLVLAQTRSHLERIRALGQDSTFLLPNGAALMSEAEPKDRVPQDREKLTIGYIGGINDRLDIALLEELTRREATWQFLFIGDNDGAVQTRALLTRPNVQYLGPLPHAEALRKLAKCQVCIIPFRSLELLASPIKLYDYLAVGKPVVSTPWSGLEGLEDFVAVATDADGFQREIQRASSEDSEEMRKRRVQAAWDNSWDSRFRALADLLVDAGILNAPLIFRKSHESHHWPARD